LEEDPEKKEKKKKNNDDVSKKSELKDDWDDLGRDRKYKKDDRVQTDKYVAKNEYVPKA